MYVSMYSYIYWWFDVSLLKVANTCIPISRILPKNVPLLDTAPQFFEKQASSFCNRPEQNATDGWF